MRTRNLLPIVRQTEVAGIAAAVNVRSIRTARGGEWHAAKVRHVMRR